MSANAIDDEGSWYALFDIGREPWATGVFDGADTSNGPPPSLSVQHAGSSCQSSGGRFTVNELEVLPNGLPDRISIDFEQLCDGATAPLYGGLRYNSNIPLVYALSVMPSTTSATVGSPVTFTGVGSSATDAVEYRFFVLRQESGQWSLVREYAADNTVTWTAPSPGSYITQLWVRRRGSAASYESYVNGPPLTVR